MSNKTIPILAETVSEDFDPLTTICDLKWNYPIFNLERGEFRSCCRTPSKRVNAVDIEKLGSDAFLNSPDMIQSRLDLVNGKRHADCQSCWNLEDSGMQSPRQGGEEFWHHLQKRNHINKDAHFNIDNLKIELGKITDITNPALKSYHPYMLEVSLGNTCDMKCMYCSHHYSTQWATERIKYGEITQEQYDLEFPKAPDSFDETFWKWFDTVKIYLGRLGIIGGEPLIMPEFYSFVDKCIKKIDQVKHLRRKKITFWIVTNMNTPPNYLEKLFNYLPKLTETFNVEILVSMESLGPRAEYIRNGVDWNRFTSNLDKLLAKKDLSFNFGFILSINALNISNLKDFIQFAEGLYHKHGRPVALKHNIVSFPDWHSPFILTPDFADHIDYCIEYMKFREPDMPSIEYDHHGRWDQYILFLENLSKSIRDNKDDKTGLRKKFYEWHQVYSQRRKKNIYEIFPDYKDFFDLCKGL